MIVENKKTDHVTWREKDAAWEKICNEFNSAAPAGIHRSILNLRKFYDNIKKTTRKTAANEKKIIKKTGGGVEALPTDNTYELTLSISNSKSVFGLENNYDSDSHFVINSQQTDNLGNTDNTENNSLSINWGSWKAKDLKNPISEELNSYMISEKQTLEQEPSMIVVAENFEKQKISTKPSTSVTMEEENSESLSNPDINKQKNKEKDIPNYATQVTPSTTDKKTQPKSWSQRRRPQLDEKNELNNIYKEAGEAKLNYFKTSEENLKRQREREEAEHELRKKALILDIKIKEEQLKTLLYADK